MRNKKFRYFLSDVLVKVFQITFGVMVVGMLVQKEFNLQVFIYGVLISGATLTMAIFLFYNTSWEENYD